MRPFDDPAQQRRRLALFNEIKDYARGQNYPGVSDGEISQMAAAASHKLDAMGSADRLNFAAQGDAAVASLVQSTFANFLSSKTEREKEAMRQPPASAVNAGADKDKPNKDGIDPLTGLMGVERQGLGGMRMAGTAGTNADSGNSGGNARGTSGSSAAYGAMDGEVYNPSKGIGTLTERNFHTSEFARAGLGISDISTIKTLSSQGFDASAIKQAGRDREMLGLGKGALLSNEVKARMFDNVAHIRRAQPELISKLDKRGKQMDTSVRAEADAIQEIEKAQREGRSADAERAQRRLRELQRKEAERDSQLGDQAKDDDTKARVLDTQKEMRKARRRIEFQRRGMKIDADKYEDSVNGDPTAKAEVKAATDAAEESGSKPKQEQAAAFKKADQNYRRVLGAQRDENRAATKTQTKLAAVKAERNDAKEDSFANLIADEPKKTGLTAPTSSKQAAAPVKPDASKTAEKQDAKPAAKGQPKVKVAGAANPAA